MATFIPIGEPASDRERQALRYLVDGLPEDYLVYGNPWLVERSGAIYRIDALVVAPHALYVVEIESYSGAVSGNDNDWYVPAPIRSPLKLNRKTAQIFADQLKRHSTLAARPCVVGIVFLSHADGCRVTGPESAERLHTRRTILQAILDRAAFVRRNGEREPVDEHVRRVVDELLTGVDRANPPPRRIREWEIEGTLERTERYVEHLATHRITREEAVLRVHDVSPLADEAERKRLEDRFRWEAQVLRRIGEHPNVLHAAAPFVDETGLVLPFERFQGLTLPSWIERHGPRLTGNAGVRARVDLWKKIASALAYAHRQGVVHRLLRPEVILIEDRLESPDLRVGGFELAKQLYLPGQTVAVSSLGDDRRRFAAPEVVRSFSDADARSDQFSLGALLGFILVGRPLFDSTEELVRRGGTFTRVREINSSLKQGLDRAIATMLSLASASRFRSLDEAVDAVESALSGRTFAPPPLELDPDNLPVGARLGADYEITGRLGAGGLATVYLALHLPSGSSRALKVAREDPRAGEALEAEHRALMGIEHPSIVRAIDITNVVPGRRTLVLERVKGEPLSTWIAGGARTETERRLLAETLLAALAYLESKGIVHKDIKPDNLIASADGLVLIDFSLASAPPDALVGTALYRDPALDRWSHVADRYAAALCLFEIYVGRHAFDGQAPAPGEAPRIDAQDFERAALADFFRKALSSNPNLRYPSAMAMRAALLDALGSRVTSSAPPGPLGAASHGSSAPLAATTLSGMARAILSRAGITTQGQLVALSEAQIRDIGSLGNKKREEVLSLRSALIAAGVAPIAGAGGERRTLFPTLSGDETDLHRLGLSPALTDALARGGFVSVGRVADATREDLTALPGVGAGRVAAVVQALQRFADTATSAAEAPATLEALWDLAAAPLQGQQKRILESLYGLRGRRAMQVELAEELETHQPNISLQKQRGLDVIDRRVLDDVVEHVEGLLVSAGGLLRIDEAASRLCERWPAAEGFDVAGLLRLLAELEPARLSCRDVLDEQPSEVLARPLFEAKALRTFLEAARTLAAWPPRAPEGVRRSLQAYLPEYPHDPLGLAVQLSRDLRLTEDGELYQAPVYLKPALDHVLGKARLPVPLEELRRAIVASFGAAVTPVPETHELVKLLATQTYCRFDPGDGQVHPAGGKSLETPAVTPDELPPELLVKDPAEAARDILRSVAKTRGYRLIVAPPDDHVEIGRSVARALGAEAAFVSFEDEFFRRVDAQIEVFDRAERFAAQRPRLRKEAEALLDALVQEHGKPGSTVVLGDTALFGTCDALHLVRRLYDLTATGGKGFWALVIPGVLHKRQPLFNEKPGATVFSIDGAVLPLSREIPEM
ncbi:protein kinase domain-containing protein [Sorangium sp. So ce1024]|uniref:protein kinase domain-containing protein n=1 Tax=Sorangium sp. So ce1024 TaxID=3133327 RepID=UPI003EFDC69F